MLVRVSLQVEKRLFGNPAKSQKLDCDFRGTFCLRKQLLRHTAKEKIFQ